MPSCVLTIASHIVLRSESGSPEAEYALFDQGEIELRSTGIGEVREAGYRTTAVEALARLEALGLSEGLVRDASAAGEMLAAKGYARGKPTHKLLGLLEGGEIFEGLIYDAGAKAYQGLWLDMRALARDLGITGSGAALQAISLYTMLGRVQCEDSVLLDTSELMAARRPGERSMRRASFRHIETLASAMNSLAGRAPVSDGERGARTADEVRRILAERGEPAARLSVIREILMAPEPPLRGPLSDPEAWAIERTLSDGVVAGVGERIDKLEINSGRQPATIYLRARLALLQGLDNPRPLAEKLSDLVMSQPFPELELLAAQAWHAANEPAKARPFIRSLTSNPNAPDLLRATAEALATQTPMQSVPPPAMPSLAPISAPAETARRATLESGFDPGADLSVPSPLAARRSSVPPKAISHPRTLTPPTSIAPVAVASSGRPQPLQAHAPPSVEPVTARPSSLPPKTASSPPPPLSLSPRSKRYYSSDGYFSAIDLEWEQIIAPSQPPPGQSPARGAQTLRFYSPTKSVVTSSDTAAATRSASQPPPSLTPRAMSARALRAQQVPELAESLALPVGGEAVPEDGSLLRSGLEVRVHFTKLARELGKSYRERFGLELWADIRGIETMQDKLVEMFRDSPPRSPAEVAEARRHGALFSEILVRTLGAEWSDISPTELGYWAMTLPPSTRVLPFGKVARFIASISNPKADAADLLAYYREVERRKGIV
ncbi:MAG: hypothetical protein ABI332_05130 [Polyangiaceae bacterium]